MYQKDMRLIEAHNDLDKVYEAVKKERAKRAFQNGIKWAVWKMLHDGMTLNEVIEAAKEHGVELF